MHFAQSVIVAFIAAGGLASAQYNYPQLNERSLLARNRYAYDSPLRARGLGEDDIYARDAELDNLYDLYTRDAEPEDEFEFGESIYLRSPIGEDVAPVNAGGQLGSGQLGSGQLGSGQLGSSGSQPSLMQEDSPAPQGSGSPSGTTHVSKPKFGSGGTRDSLRRLGHKAKKTAFGSQGNTGTGMQRRAYQRRAYLEGNDNLYARDAEADFEDGIYARYADYDGLDDISARDADPEFGFGYEDSIHRRGKTDFADVATMAMEQQRAKQAKTKVTHGGSAKGSA